MGVLGGDFSTGTRVGTASVSSEKVHYCLDSGYESNSYQLYIGKCMEEFTTTVASDPAKYTLIQEGGSMTSTCTFDGQDPINTQYWQDFEAFPIGIPGRELLVGRVEVCWIAEP
jgi:hypothetical protein